MTDQVLSLKDWRVTVDAENIAWVVFDREGESVNALGRRPLEELGQIIEWLEVKAREKAIRGVGVLSGKAGGFIVGADIREFDAFDTADKVLEAIQPVNAMFDRIVPGKITVSCVTAPICLRRLVTLNSAMSCPSMSTRPAVGAKSLGTSERTVVLPEPLGPTNATRSPCAISSEKSISAGRSAPS